MTVATPPSAQRRGPPPRQAGHIRRSKTARARGDDATEQVSQRSVPSPLGSHSLAYLAYLRPARVLDLVDDDAAVGTLEQAQPYRASAVGSWWGTARRRAA